MLIKDYVYISGFGDFPSSFQCCNLCGVLFLSPGALLLALSTKVFCGDFVIFDGLGSSFF